MANGFKKPSKVWDGWLEDLEFLELLPDSSLRVHVGHGYLLGAPIEKDLWLTRAGQRPGQDSGIDSRENEYFEVVRGLPSELLLTEPDPSREKFSAQLSVGDSTVWVNADTIRTQIDVANLYHLGLLEHDSIVELGGGYGRLAHAIISSVGPHLRYGLVDFPQVLNVVERWVRHVSPEIPIYWQRNGHFFPENSPAGLHLIPTNDQLESVSGDLLLNVNSFYEMRSDQVRHYLGAVMSRVPLIYSHNRDRQPDNTELTNPLREILADYGDVFAWSASLRSNLPPTELDKWISIVRRNNSRWQEPEDALSVLVLPGSPMPSIG